MTPPHTALLLTLATVGAALATTLTVMLLRTAREARTLRGLLAVRDEELERWVTDVLPAIAEAVGDDRDAPRYEPAAGESADSAFARRLRGAGAHVARTLAASRECAGEETMRLLLTVAREAQALAHTQQAKIVEMARRDADPDAQQRLTEIDHATAQILRRATAFVVECGTPPGRLRPDIPLNDAVRTAVGQIRGGNRVRLTLAGSDRAVAGRAVDGLILVLADLMESAARASDPRTTVQVQVQRTRDGLAVVIEDEGCALDAAEWGRTSLLLQSESPDIASLRTPPRFGLVFCGLLARRYGFAVTVDSSAALGRVRTVVDLPDEILTGAGAAVARHGEDMPFPQPFPPPFPGGDRDGSGGPSGPSGLPTRPRHRPVPLVPPPLNRTRGTGGRSAREAAVRIARFMHGVRAARRFRTVDEASGAPETVIAPPGDGAGDGRRLEGVTPTHRLPRGRRPVARRDGARDPGRHGGDEHLSLLEELGRVGRNPTPGGGTGSTSWSRAAPD
ncbi:hypothetical protein [Streptomyces sp. NPDC047108]|uniref:hypothetical protein n=1 Tax=Streptomyces sp. NPDC047108 TaxID=3155025 RepID=UPI0033D72771